MNKHRSTKRKLTLLETTLLVCAGLSLVGAGVLHAWFKTEDGKVQREIKRIGEELSDSKAAIERRKAAIIWELGELKADALLSGPSSPFESTPASRLNDIRPFSEMNSSELHESPHLAQVRP